MSTARAAGTGPPPKPVCEGAAGQELDNEKRAVPPRLDAVDVRDGRMVDGRHGPRLRLQSHQARTDTPVRVLTATSRSRRRSRARKAAPIPPVPKRLVSRYFPASSVGASVSAYSDPQSHSGVSPVCVRHRHTGHSLGRRLVQGPGFPRAHQTPDRQPRGRSKHFEKRDVARPHDPPVEAAARRQDPEQLRAGTRDPHDDVGVRLGHPPPVVTRQQAEDRRLVVRMDSCRRSCSKVGDEIWSTVYPQGGRRRSRTTAAPRGA